jgi:hypothetical protein
VPQLRDAYLDAYYLIPFATAIVNELYSKIHVASIAAFDDNIDAIDVYADDHGEEYGTALQDLPLDGEDEEDENMI